ncbi:hypothetical protein DRE_04711 [Drechslerella stenobrocha 248]|uniref:Uncharacterized protein n=1 Tax=Drechslerella stenobrocha 248 TaxID=1043628 RepID=W7I0V7_9PEZI|nr:hypothetical protein DRE_04711 [Drechslerella stenobrocha 248]
MFSGILANQAPPKQTATATIATLCDRLLHATLLEDRRAAVLGLRSFARDYKESVASGGLRGLIGTLAKDSDDVDTVKVVLETLLLLFVTEDNGSESRDDIALWLADEFTQKQDNITLLIDFLDQTDFYERLYSLKLLIAILKNRPERTRECIYTAPLGISRLVGTLDDRREIIRNVFIYAEGVQLLIALTEDHAEVQKLVAFENAFDRIFSIISAEGGLTGGFLVQDCLRLLSNLLAFNVSNQSFFRETGCVTKLTNLFGSDQTIDEILQDSTAKNLLQLLSLCKIFVTFGGSATHANQLSFWQHGLTAKVLNLAFSPSSSVDIRSEALDTLANLIRGHQALQESFAQQQVDASVLPMYAASEPVGETTKHTAYVIEALLNMALLDTNLASFNLRLAAVQCIEGYVYENPEIRFHFLDRAVKGFTSGEDETANIFNALIELDSDSRADPYRTWLSGAIFMTLIFDDQEAQGLAMQLTSGDTESGEEVVTAIQTLSSNLVSALQYGLDSRISLTFLMILCVWLYDNPEAVNDFLNEGSTIESILAIINQSNKADTILQGMCAFLMGIVFEFSTKESPIPRGTLHSLILGRLSKDQYFHKLHKLRQHPTIRDFEVIGNQPHRKGLPEVYFSSEFIEFFKDNYSHILRALDRDPGDPSGRLSNGESKMVSTEMLESVTAQLETKEDELSKLRATHTALEHKLSQEQEELRRFKESSSLTVQKIKEVAARNIASARDDAQSIQEQAEADMLAEREAHRSELQEVSLRMDAALRESRAVQDKFSQLEKELKTLREERSTREQQIDDMKGAILKVESQLNEQLDASKKLQARHESEKEVLRKSAEKQLADLRRETEVRIQEAAKATEESRKRIGTVEAELVRVKEEAQKDKEEEKQKATTAQEEMDVLMLVLSDLETTKKNYKRRLRELGEDISDEEDEEDEDEED